MATGDRRRASDLRIGSGVLKRFAARRLKRRADHRRIPRRLGPYRLGKELGRGGMGVVFRATHVHLGTPFAVKVLLAGRGATAVQIARFRREAGAVARMGKHPNIVTVHDLGGRAGLMYYAMDCVEGESLRERCKRGPLSPREAVVLLEKVARAIHFAHQHGVIHRDIKPANILLKDGEPHVVDFGLARDLAGGTRISSAGQVLGTPAYMSPEQARGRRGDARSDVYSIGAVMHELLTGHPPHPGSTPQEVLRHVRNEGVMPISLLLRKVPMDLVTLCLTCLKNRPERRYQTAMDLAEDLARWLRGEPIQGCGWKLAEDEPKLSDIELFLLMGRTAPEVLAEQKAELRARHPQGPRRRKRPVADEEGWLPEGTTLGGYQLIGRLGRGGMGSVYVATQLSLDREVALKVLSGPAAEDPEFVKRFHREIQVLARLNHPNIVSILDRGREGGVLFYAMELVDGISLRPYFDAQYLSLQSKLILIPGICLALEYAHSKGVVHRDIKPENILIGPRLTPKVVDFGVARLLEREGAEGRLTRTGGIVGTYDYLAPEQREDPRRADARSDLFSLGVVVYEMLTGELPLGIFTPPSVRTQIGTELQAEVLALLQQEPGLRPSSARPLRKAVEQALREGGVP